MDENKFWISLWKISATFLCVVVVVVAGCTANRQYQTRMLVENAKVSPIEANCALEADSLKTTACIMLVSK